MTKEEREFLIFLIQEVDPDIPIDDSTLSDSIWINIKNENTSTNHEIWVKENFIYFNDRSLPNGAYYFEKKLDLTNPDSDPVEWLRAVIEGVRKFDRK